MPVHTLSLLDRTLDPGTGCATRWPKFTAEEAAELREKGFRATRAQLSWPSHLKSLHWSDLPFGTDRSLADRPDEDEFRLSLPLQTIEDREHGTLTIEQG